MAYLVKLSAAFLRAFINGGLWVVQPDLKIGVYASAYTSACLHVNCPHAVPMAFHSLAGEYLWELMVEGHPEVHPNGTYDNSRPRAFWRVADQDLFRFAFSDWEWGNLVDRPQTLNYRGGFPKASEWHVQFHNMLRVCL